MKNKIKLLAICGSTRKRSSNLSLIKAIAKLGKEDYIVSIFEKLSDLPHFNPDHDNEQPPLLIENFRKQLRDSQAILICTPEYAMGVPGTLKNAIDWTVSSMEFAKKPVALITASLAGEKAHASLLDTLQIIEAQLSPLTQVLISSIKTKVSEDSKITDAETLNKVNNLLKALISAVYQRV